MQAWVLKNRYDTPEPLNLDPNIHNTPAALERMNPGSNANLLTRMVGPNGQPLRIGDLMVANASYKSAVKAGQHRGMSMELPLMSPRAATLATGSLTSYERPPGIILLEQQALTVAALFSQGQTTREVIRAFRETSYTQAATSVAEEGQKPEATFALEEADFPVEKIAVLGRVTDEMFADFPEVRDYVNSRLIFMAQSKEDDLLLNGNGSTPNIRGVLNTSGISTVSGAAGLPMDAIHRAITKVRFTGFFEPDGVIMNPLDWENVKLTKDGNGQYYGGGPLQAPYGTGEYKMVGTIWGLPVVVTTAIAQGTALVGAFRMGAQIWRREGVRIDSTNSDSTDFQFNRICIRVESRQALAVYRPLAFCTVTGIPSV
jgi:HK97 family phage major capsid protein